MSDNIPIIDQMHELQVLVNRFHDLKIIVIPESLQVEAIIAKFPPTWNGILCKNRVFIGKDSCCKGMFNSVLIIIKYL